MSTRSRLQLPCGGDRPFLSAFGAVCCLAFGVAGCSGLDGAELAQFTPFPPDRFEMRAKTNLFYGPGADTWGEGQRLRWLANYVRLNSLCPRGYELNSRTVSFEYQSPLGYPVDEIVYRGRCAG
ncbi:MAG TPA: hypothetical protein VFA12_17870 [Stellaceae bacterium]|nr:hypothetical protein [Stellaceae bacterium]